MSHFFPDAHRVSHARRRLADGHYGDLDETMGVSSLARPCTRETTDLIEEFGRVVDELELRDEGTTGFIVLVPVNVQGSSFTTPVLVDIERRELAFTSHPTFGAGTIPEDVISSNPNLPAAIREQLLGVLATWHNAELAEDAV